MKKIIPGWIGIVVTVLLLVSCEKEAVQRREVIKELTIDTTLKAGGHYYLELAPYGDEGDIAAITEKPMYASVSRMENVSDMFTSVYHYASLANAAGKSERITLTIKHTDSASTAIYLNISLK